MQQDLNVLIFSSQYFLSFFKLVHVFYSLIYGYFRFGEATGRTALAAVTPAAGSSHTRLRPVSLCGGPPDGGGGALHSHRAVVVPAGWLCLPSLPGAHSSWGGKTASFLSTAPASQPKMERGLLWNLVVEVRPSFRCLPAKTHPC